MKRSNTYVAAIAGYDPSAGAGVMADIKTLESLKVYGFGITTCLTWQNGERFEKLEWLSTADIVLQLGLFVPNYSIKVVKIGVVKNEDMLRTIIQFIRENVPGATIIWDPVLQSSSGFTFFEGTFHPKEWTNEIDIITPNLDEFNQMFDSEEEALAISGSLSVYRKGGHHLEKPGVDTLFHKGKTYPLNPKRKDGLAKHGSGCVFSSALAAHIASGHPVLKACLRSKRYIEHFLASNKGMLGFHKI